MRRSFPATCVALVVALAQHQAIFAADSQTPLPGVYLELTRCRGLTDAAAKASCFDAATAAMDRAIASGDLFITDRTQVNAAKAASFGLATPAPGLTLNETPEDAGKAATDELPGVIKSVRSTPDGWVVALEDGSVWYQADAISSGIDPKPGMPVTVKHAALGSYRLMLNKNVGFKVKRAK
jgi:hypothetical protein